LACAKLWSGKEALRLFQVRHQPARGGGKQTIDVRNRDPPVLALAHSSTPRRCIARSLARIVPPVLALAHSSTPRRCISKILSAHCCGPNACSDESSSDDSIEELFERFVSRRLRWPSRVRWGGRCEIECAEPSGSHCGRPLGRSAPRKRGGRSPTRRCITSHTETEPGHICTGTAHAVQTA
jgi:hypothetical protein